MVIAITQNENPNLKSKEPLTTLTKDRLIELEQKESAGAAQTATSSQASAVGSAADTTADNTADTTADAVVGSTAEPVLSEEDALELEPRHGTTLYYYISDGCSAGPSMADALGYFADAGLTVEGYKGDASSDVDALGTAAVDLNVGHFAKQIVPATNGVDLVFVGGAHSGCKSLVVMADSPYQTTEDLKGLKISTPNGIGKSDYNITARLLDADGINPMTGVELVQVETGACVPAMQRGELAAALLSDTFIYQMVKEGTLRVIRSMLDEDLNQICCAISMNGTFAKENPITAAKMASCVKRAHEWMAANPEEATQMLVDLGLSSGDYDMNVEINKSLQYGSSDAFTEEQLQMICEDYKRLGLMTTTDSVAEIMEKIWIPMG